ncbi:MAG: hypothetical protein KGI33_04960 [Thaumarchaeota archaeon]|nr:hypothetical protein [Nitrososphaerota archaeon]
MPDRRMGVVRCHILGPEWQAWGEQESLWFGGLLAEGSRYDAACTVSFQSGTGSFEGQASRPICNYFI